MRDYLPEVYEGITYKTMSEPAKTNSSTLDLLRESRDTQAKEVETLQEKLDAAKAELKKLNAALKQWTKE